MSAISTSAWTTSVSRVMFRSLLNRPRTGHGSRRKVGAGSWGGVYLLPAQLPTGQPVPMGSRKSFWLGAPGACSGSSTMGLLRFVDDLVLPHTWACLHSWTGSRHHGPCPVRSPCLAWYERPSTAAPAPDLGGHQRGSRRLVWIVVRSQGSASSEGGCWSE